MKKSYLILAFLVCISGLSYGQYQFEIEKSLPCTSVKNQQLTGTCWSFATSSFMESEIQRIEEKSLDLSEMFTVRTIYLDKARNYLLRQGKANFSEGSLAHDVARAIEMAGAIPESVYDGKLNPQDMHDHSEMERVMKSVLDAFLKGQGLSDKWEDLINGILDVYMGEVPASFTISGKEYTPRTYAEALQLKLENYISITSFSHRPFYKKFVLEIPDNYSNGSYYNVPIDELSLIVDQALAKGYTVAWDGDVSEKGFSAQSGIAILPVDPNRQDKFKEPGKEIRVTQKNRQMNFENLSTTDDHLMHLVGSAVDQYGTKYYIIKNSWGEISEYKGFLYMSQAYFNMKTIAITINKDVLPTNIAQKLAP